MVLYASSVVDAATDVPVIDLATLREGNEAEIQKLFVAAKEWGFLHVANHGVPHELLREIEEHAHHTFALPDETKEKNATPAGGFNGYNYRSEHTAHWMPWGEGLRLPLQPQRMEEILTKLWPKGNEAFSRVSKEYVAAVHPILLDLLKHLALNLGVDSSEFTRDVCIDGHASTITLKFYPALTSEPPKPTLCMPSHTDPQLLTILYENDVDGLQILKNDKWIAIKPRPGCFNVLVGDTLQVMSNDIYRSCTHKVVVKRDAFRFVVLYAITPAGKAIVKPAPQLVTTKMPSQYRPFTSDEFYLSLRGGKVHGQLHLDKFRIAP